MTLRALALLFACAPAFADGPVAGSSVRAIDRLASGAPLYVVIRPAAAVTALERLGVAETRDLASWKQRFGLDPLDLTLLAPTGIDASAPACASLFEVVERPGFFHHRIVARLDHEARLPLFLEGMASAKREPQVSMVAVDSALGRAGVRATVALAEGGVAIVRLEPGLVVVDVAQPWEDKPPTAIDLAHRFPLVPTHRFDEHGAGARQLLTSDGAASLFIDGRLLPSLMPPLERSDPRWAAPASTRGQGWKHARSEALAEAERCRSEWSHAAAVFDDFGATLALDDRGVTARLGWGAASPILKFTVADDAPLDRTALASDATFAAGLTADGYASLRALPRTGPFASSPPDLYAVYGAARRCGPLAWPTVLVRHLPQLLALVLDAVTTRERGRDIEAVLDRLRNLLLLVRTTPGDSMHYAVAASLAAGSRPAVETLLGPAGAPETKRIGDHQPAVYSIAQLTDGAAKGLLAVDDLPSGKLLLVGADQPETLTWTLEPTRATPAAHLTPATLGWLRLDTHRFAELPGFHDIERDPVGRRLVRAGLIEGTLVDEGNLLVLTLRAPLR